MAMNKKILRNWIALPAIAALVMPLLASCSSTDGDTANATSSGGTIEVTFNIVTKEAKATRSGTWASYDESNDILDYESEINSLSVLLYNTDNSLAAVVSQQSLTESDGTYYYTGKLTLSDEWTSSTFEGKVVVFANCEDIITTSQGYGFSHLGETTYDFSSPNDGGKLSTGIPMWGMASVSINFSSSKTVSLGEIDILRAMARIELALDEETVENGYSFVSAELSDYNTSGYCVPEGYEEVESTSAISLDCLSIPDDVVQANSSLAFISSDSNDTLMIAYVPEYENTKSASTITLKIQRTDEKGNVYPADSEDNVSKTLYFKPYEDGEANEDEEYFDLIRNHTYRYSLHKKDESQLYVSNTISEWETVTSTIGWDVSEATFAPRSSGSSYDADAEYCLICYPRWAEADTAHTSTEEVKAFASYEFTFKTPSDGGQVTWKAYLTNTEYFYFNTGTSDLDDTKYNASTGVSRDESYSIKIGPYKLWGDITETYWELIDDDYKRSVTDDDGNVTYVYICTELFIVAMKSDGSYEAVDINPAYDDDDAHFTPNRYPGGTYEITRTVDGQEFTLGENQWMRIYQAEAVTTEGENSYDDVCKLISDNSEENQQWWKGEDDDDD